MSSIAEPPTSEAQSVFKSVDSFETTTPRQVTPPTPEKVETPPPAETRVETDKPDAVKKPDEAPKSRLDKIGQVKKPEPKKIEEVKEEKPAETVEKPVEPGNIKQLREAYDKQKADMAALRSELEKVRPNAAKVEEYRKELDMSREELTKLKALNLNDEERGELSRMREVHALESLRESKEYREKILAPIQDVHKTIVSAIKGYKLAPAAAEALKLAVDIPDEIDRNREIRRIGKEAEMESDDFTDFYTSMTAAARDLNKNLYPKLDAAERQALEISQSSKVKQKEEAEHASLREKETFKKEYDFVKGQLSDNQLKALLEDTDLSVEGVTLAQALAEAEPATNPREKALEVQAAAAMPFLITALNNALQRAYDAEDAAKARNGAAPKLSDGASKDIPNEQRQLDANSVFKSVGTFGSTPR